MIGGGGGAGGMLSSTRNEEVIFDQPKIQLKVNLIREGGIHSFFVGCFPIHVYSCRRPVND